ncbi:MAG: flagellar protein, partial [Hyphomicrobiaceae bacterium]|nr:flagellar protein [Hyphomicrobiaceae bacterium]
MADIMLSKAVRSNLLSLQNTAEMMAKTQERLSTGLKVNSALDDPSAFFTSSSLQSRAGDLSRILDSVSNAVQTIRAADEGISAITKLVESAQATARQALQSSKPSNAKVEGTGGTISADKKASVTGTGLANQNNLLSSLETATDTKPAETAGSAAVTTTTDLSNDITGFVADHTSTLSFGDANDIDGGAAGDQAANGEVLSIT